ncbi:unnamed protein product [Rotaria magnacalcarata]|uniref:Uncharacterized protein n=1 Tax=Rotaria magnacalcarata TaxID=392030 RepID=A0A815QUP6_9BILA|nr:unnamed protein product [Rotaria magnacalcarata]CAF1572346.1 unnamed protein product [Rotaria magnacalcarata]
MDITYAHRQHLVREMKPIKEIIELYPALSITGLEVIDGYPIIQIQTAKNIKNYSIVIEYNTIITTNSQAEAISILIG